MRVKIENFNQSLSWIFLYLNCWFVLFCDLILHHCTSVHKKKLGLLGRQPHVEQQWHGNLQQDVRALLILLRVGRVEPDTRNVTFGGILEGLNDDQCSCCLRSIKRSRGYQRWLESPVNSLSKADRAHYIAVILRRILRFLQLE
jgi:hypothetical protein